MIRNETQSSIAGPATFGMAAMLLWGSYPLWYHAVAHVPVFELLLHRVIWSSMFIVPLTYLVFTKKDEVRRIVQSRKTLGLVVLSALVLSVWWLSSFSSGLCMPEIAAMGAIERLDNMVNDALYGILYRDINMERTLVDQAFSRAINGAAGIVINTGEDNYLRTADPLEAAPSVVVSQMINFEMARCCALTPELIGIGNSIAILPEWQRCGLGLKLYQAVAKFAINTGRKLLFC